MDTTKDQLFSKVDACRQCILTGSHLSTSVSRVSAVREGDVWELPFVVASYTLRRTNAGLNFVELMFNLSITQVPPSLRNEAAYDRFETRVFRTPVINVWGANAAFTAASAATLPAKPARLDNHIKTTSRLSETNKCTSTTVHEGYRDDGWVHLAETVNLAMEWICICQIAPRRPTPTASIRPPLERWTCHSADACLVLQLYWQQPQLMQRRPLKRPHTCTRDSQGCPATRLVSLQRLWRCVTLAAGNMQSIKEYSWTQMPRQNLASQSTCMPIFVSAAATTRLQWA